MRGHNNWASLCEGCSDLGVSGSSLSIKVLVLFAELSLGLETFLRSFGGHVAISRTTIAAGTLSTYREHSGEVVPCTSRCNSDSKSNFSILHAGEILGLPLFSL